MPLDNSQREALTAIGAVALLGLILAIGYGSFRDTVGSAPPAVNLEDPIPLDPDVRAGTLKNRLSYFIRKNSNPSGRAELRLVVDAGAVLETDEQRGLAHAVEHMAFRGTRSFRGRKMIDYLESIGIHSGDDVNAHTSRDETTYEINIPTDRPGAIDTALTMMAEWAHAITFDPAEANHEAGVVFEEWRYRSRVGQRLRDAREAFLLSGSKYAERPTIGDTTVLRRFDLRQMRQFYKDWYRPELMAVVAVGDFELPAIEALIRRHFGAIPASPSPITRPRVNVSVTSEPRFAVLADAEAAATQITLWFLRPPSSYATMADYRDLLVGQMWRSILDDRLTKAAEQLEAPLLRSSVVRERLVRHLNATAVRGTVMQGKLEDGVGMLAEHLTSIAAFGPDSVELEEAKRVIRSSRSEADAHGLSSDDIAAGLMSHYLLRTPAFGPEQDYDLTRSLLDNIDVDDVRNFGRRFGLDSGVALTISTTAQDRSAGVIRAPALFAAAKRGALRASRPTPDTTTTPALIANAPKPGKVVSETFHLGIGVHEWKLSNGMRVLLKPTKYQEAHSELRITAPVGAKLASVEDYASAYMSDRIVETAGVGPLTGSQLSRMIDRTSIDLSPLVTDHWIQLSGTAALSEVSELFQLAHLFFTAPRSDPDAFRRYRERQRLWAAERSADPEDVFDDSVAVAVERRLPREILSTRPFVEAVDMSSALGFWRARMANASNFTAVIVGDITTDLARKQVEQYLASLPAGHPETVEPTPLGQPSAPVERSFRLGWTPQARTALVFRGSVKLDSETNAMLWRVRELLQLAIEDRLRESLGGTYDVSVTLQVPPIGVSTYQMMVEFTADPERVDSLAAAAFGEIDRLRSKGPTLAELQKVRAAARSDHERSEESNDFWLSELTWHAILGTPLDAIEKHKGEIDALTRAKLREACARYLETGRYTRVTMKPARAPGDVR